MGLARGTAKETLQLATNLNHQSDGPGDAFRGLVRSVFDNWVVLVPVTIAPGLVAVLHLCMLGNGWVQLWWAFCVYLPLFAVWSIALMSCLFWRRRSAKGIERDYAMFRLVGAGFAALFVNTGMVFATFPLWSAGGC